MQPQYDPDLVFYEEQRFSKTLVTIFAISTLVTAGVLIAVWSYMRSSAQYPQVFIVVAAAVMATEIVLLWLFASAAMITEIRSDGLHVGARPFKRLRRRIPFDQIKTCEARTYSPLREYGGWGIRFGPSGKAYNMTGNTGVQLELASGERLLIGSRKAEELAAEINRRIR